MLENKREPKIPRKQSIFQGIFGVFNSEVSIYIRKIKGKLLPTFLAHLEQSRRATSCF
jgi:hypothetical protein